MYFYLCTLTQLTGCSSWLPDRELHQREYEDRDGSAAAERRPQPHGGHVGNGH